MSELKQIKEALRVLQLTPNATTLYLASFKLGWASIGMLAAHIEMDRSSAYKAFEQLKQAGLIEEIVDTRGRLISARSPKTILAKLRSRSRELRRHQESLESSLPEILAAYSSDPAKPVLQFFSGPDGLRMITDDVLEHAQGEILLFTNQHEERKVFTKQDHDEFVRDRKEKGIHIRVLTPDTPEAHDLQFLDRSRDRETRIITDQPMPFTCETYIYADRVAMLQFDKEIMGFIVRSKTFADAQRWLFEEIWRNHADKNA